MKQIKWCIDVASDTVDPDAEEKKNDVPAKRPSVIEKLNKYKEEVKENEHKKAPTKRQERER